MYYPFLRARQFELIALRELANEEITQGYTTPILEPIKEGVNNLNLAYRVFQEHDQQAYLIVNPLNGEQKGDTQYYSEYLSKLNHKTFKAAFHFRNNTQYILDSISEFNQNDCMIICQNDIDLDDPSFQKLVTSSNISIITIEDPEKNRTLDRYVKGLDKTYVRLDDFFEKQIRNSDFLGIQEHRFSEEHLYFKDDGYDGFSDYTVLPSEYVEGGSTPRAVVIHLTYLNDQQQVWIRHFTSDSNASIANVQGKFAEAAKKAVEYCRANKLTNSAILELEDYYDQQHYPGLGTVKKLSLKNHLLIISEYLKAK